MKKPFLFTLILTVVASTVSLLLLWYINKTEPEVVVPVIKNETAGWKTYKNEEYGFEFKYPGNFNQIETNTFFGDKPIIAFSNGEKIDPIIIYINGPIDFPVNSFEGSGEESFLSTKLIDFNQFADYYLKKGWGKRINIGGFDTYIEQGRMEYNPTMYVDIENNKYVYFSINSMKESKEFAQIFQSLKKIKKDETSGWKTYKNEEFGFEFKYPSEYTVLENQYNNIAELKTEKHTVVLSQISSSSNISQNELEKLLIENVVFDGSGFHPESFAEFAEKIIGGKKFYSIKDGRFEGDLGFVYFISTPNGIYRMKSISHFVDVTNPKLDEENDSGHLITKKILSTFKFTK